MRIRWLHIADLHGGDAASSRVWPQIRNPLQKDLERNIGSHGKLDFIVFAGDIGNRGQKTDYEAATKVLAFIRDVVGTAIPVVVVPGNHDLGRPQARDATVAALTHFHTMSQAQADPDKDDVLDALRDTGQPYAKQTAEWFVEFAQWASSNSRKPESTGTLPGDALHSLEIRGERVGIVTVNSSLLHFDDKKEGSLWVHGEQLRCMASNDPQQWLSGNNLNLLVTHHPTDWLTARSSHRFATDLAIPTLIDLHLHGHVHIPRGTSFAPSPGATPKTTIGAPALVGTETTETTFERIHGYVISECDFRSDTIALRHWYRRAYPTDSHQWQFTRDPSKLAGDDDDATPWETRPLRRAPIRKPAAPPTTASASTKGKLRGTPATRTTTGGQDPGLERAVANIVAHGDTDVFPFPPENLAFAARSADFVALLSGYASKLSTAAAKQLPLVHETSQIPVSYSGYRWATQIDPAWNALYLAAAIDAAPQIEARRSSADTVFSYRFAPSSTGVPSPDLFQREFNWRAYNEHCEAESQAGEWIVRADIADFYDRCSHEHLKRELHDAGVARPTIDRVALILNRLSGGVGTGLPVGGPASRLLSECILSRVDVQVAALGYRHARFSDDFTVFCSDESHAHQAVLDLSAVLRETSGLALQKLKTRLIAKREFLQERELSRLDTDETRFLALRLRYDPYADTAAEDYEEFRQHVSGIDVLGILEKEISKSRFDESLVRQIVRSVIFLEEAQRQAVCRVLCDNYTRLHPVGRTLLIAFNSILNSVDENSRASICSTLEAAIASRQPAYSLPAALGYALRTIATASTLGRPLPTPLFQHCASRHPSRLVQREAIVGLGRADKALVLAGLSAQFDALSPWTRRALLIARSRCDAGAPAWIKSMRKTLSEYDLLICEWAQDEGESSSVV